MQYRKLGKTGIRVSGICLGTMTYGGQVDEKDAINIIERAVDACEDCQGIWPEHASVCPGLDIEQRYYNVSYLQRNFTQAVGREPWMFLIKR